MLFRVIVSNKFIQLIASRLALVSNLCLKHGRYISKRYNYTELFSRAEYQIFMILSRNNNNNCLQDHVKITPTTAMLVLIIVLIAIILYSDTPIPAFASNNSNGTVLRSLTNGSSLEVLLAPLPSTADEETQFRVGFLQPNKTELQEHVDFDFIALKNGKEVFRASNQTGQPNIPLHSIPGTMDIPIFTYDFQKTGEYTIKIPVFGILFNPIQPEETEFRIRY